MCDICLPVLGRYAKSHRGKPCSLEKALYCGRCATHGHSRARCTVVVVKGVIELDSTVDIVYHLDTLNMFEVEDTDGTVRAVLSANGVVPMICQKKGKKEKRDFIENKRRLLDLAKKRGQILVLKSYGSVT